MIPLNQTLEVAVADTFQMRYIASAIRQTKNEWAVFLHHGGAYVDRVAPLAVILPMFEHIADSVFVTVGTTAPALAIPLPFSLPAGMALGTAISFSLWLNDWAQMYYGLRFLDDGTERLQVSVPAVLKRLEDS